MNQPTAETNYLPTTTTPIPPTRQLKPISKESRDAAKAGLTRKPLAPDDAPLHGLPLPDWGLKD